MFMHDNQAYKVFFGISPPVFSPSPTLTSSPWCTAQCSSPMPSLETRASRSGGEGHRGLHTGGRAILRPSWVHSLTQVTRLGSAVLLAHAISDFVYDLRYIGPSSSPSPCYTALTNEVYKIQFSIRESGRHFVAFYGYPGTFICFRLLQSRPAPPLST